MSGTSEMLSLKGVSIYYGKAQAVSEFSLTLGAQEFVALIGRNGAGKSTILSAIVGLVETQGGEIWFGSHRLNGLAPHEVYRLGIVLVPQERGIFSDLSVRDNLMLGAFPRLLSSTRAEVHQDYEAMVERFPLLKAKAKTAAGQLSGGEQQMLAIARALMARPSVLLLDEPYLGLDPINRRAVSEVVRQLHSSGTTVLMAEQNLDPIMRTADQVVLINGGRIVEQTSGSDIVGDRASMLITTRKHAQN